MLQSFKGVENIGFEKRPRSKYTFKIYFPRSKCLIHDFEEKGDLEDFLKNLTEFYIFSRIHNSDNAKI